MIDRLMFVDVDECDEGIDGCDHMCANTVGSFNCSCHPGFHLLDDDITCAGEADVSSLTMHTWDSNELQDLY